LAFLMNIWSFLEAAVTTAFWADASHYVAQYKASCLRHHLFLLLS
jgi:hypothetical protein